MAAQSDTINAYLCGDNPSGLELSSSTLSGWKTGIIGKRYLRKTLTCAIRTSDDKRSCACRGPHGSVSGEPKAASSGEGVEVCSNDPVKGACPRDSRPTYAGCDEVGIVVDMMAVDVGLGVGSASWRWPDVTVLMTSLAIWPCPCPPKSEGDDAEEEDEGRSDDRAPRVRTLGPLRWSTSL